MDPYAVLGVPRTATRLEVARAYRALAKRWHPDAGGDATPEMRANSMARINRAWHILSNPARRAEWDARHGSGPLPHWGAAPATRGAWAPPRSANQAASPGSRARAGAWAPPVMERPAPVEREETSLRDSGWLALVVAALLLVLFIGGVGIVSQMPFNTVEPPDGGAPVDAASEIFAADGLRFAYPEGWTVVGGADDGSRTHGIVAHVVTFDLAGADPCVDLADPCAVTGDAIPAGQISVIVTRWEGGTPPVPEPLRRRAFGLDADRIIGGEPAAFRWDSGAERAIGWWQLSPPGFPDRWYEVVAEIRGREREQLEGLEAVDAMLSTLEFEPDGGS